MCCVCPSYSFYSALSVIFAMEGHLEPTDTEIVGVILEIAFYLRSRIRCLIDI